MKKPLTVLSVDTVNV